MSRMFVIACIVIACLVPCLSAVAGWYPCESDRLEVMFQPEIRVRLADGGLISGNRSKVDFSEIESRFGNLRWERVCGQLPEELVDGMHAVAESNLRQNVYNMNNMYYLEVSNANDVWAVADALNHRLDVLHAAPVPLPQPLPFPTPNHEPQQDYLNNASEWPPTGLNAYYAWTESGGSGLGVTVCDIEYHWNYAHVDLSKAVWAQLNPYEQSPADADLHHGTAVLGELIADSNGWGVTGICHEANVKTYGSYWDPNSPYTNPSWRVPEAIMNAGAVLLPGDVLLLEQQWEYNSGTGNYIPIEWWTNHYPDAQSNNGVYAAIQTLVGNGIHVVEAAGNGGMNLDVLSWYGDSGAIVVGAGGAYSGGYYPQGDLFPLDISCYGNRVNVQGWGEDVTTAGYGTYEGETGLNDMFCGDFAGTSSASAMVAGAVVDCVGYWTRTLSENAADLSPALLRTLLINSGTPQDTWTTHMIGPRPDLEGAFRALDQFAPARFLEVDLELPSQHFSEGDLFNLWAFVNNPGHNQGILPLVVILEVSGAYWFYPSWTQDFQFYPLDVLNGYTSYEVIPDFYWPAGTGSASGLRFYGALLTPDLLSIFGLYDMEEFSFGA